MKLANILNEEWIKSVGSSYPTDVFKNPESKEVQEMLNGSHGLRYLLPKSGSGDVFAWSDNSSYIHEDMIPKLGLNRKDYFWMHFWKQSGSLSQHNVNTPSEVQLLEQYFSRAMPYEQKLKMVPKLIEDIKRAMGNGKASAIMRRSISLPAHDFPLKMWLERWAEDFSR